jgi:N-acetylglucosaminyldiphosphoundecaprenol N-acetyl-beta-D-mannosaminyltransferase
MAISSPRFMGVLLVNAGRLSAENVERIINFQKKNGMRFGEIGRALGFLTEEDVRFALSVQYHYVKSTGTAEEWVQHWLQLLNKIERVQTPAERRRLLERLSYPVRPFVLAFANAHAMNSLAISNYFFKTLCSADVVLRDGSGMAALFKFLKVPPGLNLNGTDLIPELLRQFNGRCIALFGTQNPYLERGLKVVQQKFAPQSPCISANGFLDTDTYITLANQNRPALIVLGMGMPRQEEVAAALRSSLAFPCLIVCGGAVIDFLGGKTLRAPSWIRKIGMEWVFRLGMEPRRLFQRYVIGNPVFLTRALRVASLSQLQGELAPGRYEIPATPRSTASE